MSDDQPRPLRADARRNRARILTAAESVFNERGAEASTEEVARRAGVGIGTVFRHFPTKTDLLRAIVSEGLDRMTDRTRTLLAEGDPAEAFFEFFTEMVAIAATKKTIVDLLARDGFALPVEKPIQAWREAVVELLSRARAVGAVRCDVADDTVFALLISLSQAAVTAGWNEATRSATLRIVFDGLRPLPTPP